MSCTIAKGPDSGSFLGFAAFSLLLTNGVICAGLHLRFFSEVFGSRQLSMGGSVFRGARSFNTTPGLTSTLLRCCVVALLLSLLCCVHALQAGLLREFCSCFMLSLLFAEGREHARPRMTTAELVPSHIQTDRSNTRHNEQVQHESHT